MRKLPELKNVKLDIGCGGNTIKGFVGMDIRDCGQGIVWDARQGIPFPDNSIEEIHTSHFLEHLNDEESLDFLRESLRTLKHGRLMINRLPHVLDSTAFYPGHKTFWNEERVEALQRLEEPLPIFLLIENFKEGRELKFTFKKI